MASQKATLEETPQDEDRKVWMMGERKPEMGGGPNEVQRKKRAGPEGKRMSGFKKRKNQREGPQKKPRSESKGKKGGTLTGRGGEKRRNGRGLSRWGMRGGNITLLLDKKLRVLDQGGSHWDCQEKLSTRGGEGEGQIGKAEKLRGRRGGDILGPNVGKNTSPQVPMGLNDAAGRIT